MRTGNFLIASLLLVSSQLFASGSELQFQPAGGTDQINSTQWLNAEIGGHTLLISSETIQPEVIETQSLEGLLLQIEGCAYSSEPGSPLLPMKNIRYAFAGRFDISNVEIRPVAVLQSVTENSVMPGQMSISWTDNDVFPDYDRVTNENVYTADSYCPGRWLDVTTGYNGDSTIVNVHVYPVQWNPESRSTLFLQSFDVLINGTETNSATRNRGHSVDELD